MHFSRGIHVTEDDWDDRDGHRDRERQADVNSEASCSLVILAEGDRSFPPPSSLASGPDNSKTALLAAPMMLHARLLACVIVTHRINTAQPLRIMRR